MLLLMLPTLFSLLHKEFMHSICSHVINSGTVTIFRLLVILTVSRWYHENISSMLCLDTLLCIFRNRVVLLILWLYSSSIKTFKYVLIISCLGKSQLMSVLMFLYKFHIILIFHILQRFLQLHHLTKHIHLHMSTFIGI